MLQSHHLTEDLGRGTLLAQNLMSLAYTTHYDKTNKRYYW